MTCIIMHMEHNYASPIVIKYGGNAMLEPSPPITPSPPKGDPTLAEAAALHEPGDPVVLVHGGGPEIDRRLAANSIEIHRIDGLRVTSAEALEITEAVLCATINKRLVRAFALAGTKAAGISGQDGGVLVARFARGRRGENLGYVGEIVDCDPGLLLALLRAGYLPVVAPLAIAEDGSNALNVNADLAAAAIAGALRARAFVISTNVARVLRDPADPSSAIDRMTIDEARAFMCSPACSGGMLPKLRSAVTAVETGAKCAYICAAGPGAIARALNEADATIIGGRRSGSSVYSVPTGSSSDETPPSRLGR